MQVKNIHYHYKGCADVLKDVYVEDLSNVINIALRLVFYITGIFYDVEKRLPAPWGGYITKVNPLAYMISSARNAVLYGQNAGWKALLMWFVLSIVLVILGVRLVYKNENNYVKVI